jgi:glucuronate isomerase
MSEFLSDDFLLHSDVARELYHDYAKREPIFDYHCHLPPDQIASNRSFRNLYEVWLGGDHYKWRAMRSDGVAEKFCTGDASDWEKFLAYARTVPHLLRNPLYHWTHLELKSYFGIEALLSDATAEEIWNRANAQLATPELSVHGLLTKSRVAVVCTTDDPTNRLESHRKIRADGRLGTRVYPTFRPDKALAIDQPDLFNKWVDALSDASGIDCSNFGRFLDALKQRHDDFHACGGRLSDHGLPRCYAEECTEDEAAKLFEAARTGRQLDCLKADAFRSFLMRFFGELAANRGWTMQLHLGAIRNNNTRLFCKLGPDAGFDSIGDARHAEPLARFLDQLDQREKLPKTIIYNLNPADNYVFASMIGNFQDGSIPGKIQFGSSWWFLDQKEAIEWQLNAISSLGLLSRFVGMLTDSRSFLSFPRHEYFRRILCNLIGRDVMQGELPRDMSLLGNMVRDISFRNAEGYFGLEMNRESIGRAF